MHINSWVSRLISRVVFVIVGITGIYGCIVFLFFRDWSASGVFGDTFGAINAIFSGLAFSGLVITIYLQRIQLDDQNKFNKLQFLQTRYDYLLGQIKSWTEKKVIDHHSFFGEVEEHWGKCGDEEGGFDFHSKIYYKYGNKYQHFVNVLKETIRFITNEYVPSNSFSLNQKNENELFINILISKLRDEDLVLLAIHAEFMDEKLQNLLEEHAFFVNLREEVYSKYSNISEIFNHKYATWEQSGGLPI